MDFRREFSTNENRKTSYLVAGEGPTLILIPGLMNSAAHWQEYGYFDRFAPTYRVIAIDPLGHGESDCPTDVGAYAAELVVDDIIGVLEQEASSGACIWGHGLGAQLAAQVARRRPDLVAGLVYACAYLGDIGEALAELGIDFPDLAERSAVALDNDDWDAYFDLLGPDVPPDVRAELEAANSGAVAAALHRATLLRPRSFLKPTVPTFAYWSQDDGFSEENRGLAESLSVQWTIISKTRTETFRGVNGIAEAVDRFAQSLVRA